MSNNFIYSLLIDTSNSKSIVSLNINDKPHDFNNLNLDKDLSFSLFPTIKNLLEKSNISFKNLSFIAIGTGPGSYTGIRVGAACAKSLSYASDIPLIGFCSLKAFIPPPDISSSFYSIIDAKSGGIYLLEGEKNKNTIIYKNKPHLVPINDVSAYLKKNYVLVSPHMSISLKQKLCLSNDKKCFFDVYPNCDHLAKLLFYKFSNKNFTLSDKLNLLYLRGPKPIAL